VRALVASRNCLIAEAEADVLGATHSEVAEWLLRKWGLPARLVNPVAFQGDFHPSREFADRTAVVHVANVMCRARGYGYAGDNRLPALHTAAWDLLNLDMAEIEEVYLQVEADLETSLVL